MIAVGGTAELGWEFAVYLPGKVASEQHELGPPIVVWVCMVGKYDKKRHRWWSRGEYGLVGITSWQLTSTFRWSVLSVLDLGGRIIYIALKQGS